VVANIHILCNTFVEYLLFSDLNKQSPRHTHLSAYVYVHRAIPPLNRCVLFLWPRCSLVLTRLGNAFYSLFRLDGQFVNTAMPTREDTSIRVEIIGYRTE